MKKLIWILLAAAAFSCEDDKLAEGCVEQPNDGRACYEIYAPVCGCNGKTYSNDCFALAVGITEFTQGACKEASE